MPRGAGEWASLPSLRAASPALRSALRRDRSLSGKIKALLAEAGGVFECPPSGALYLTGFGPGDRTPGRLDAALAELRAALFLRGEGFSGIRPLATAAGRTPDLAARRGGELWAFEVRWVRGGLGGAPEKLSAKCARKAAQLGAGLKALGAGRCGIILVGEPLGFGPFAPSPELAALAAAVEVPVRACRPHICLLAGGASGVFPPWP